MNKLLLITCYIGKLPSYFNLFLESCSRNPLINWLILTDDNSAFQYPSNVTREHITLDAINERVKKCFGGGNFAIRSPYKLCDYKPVYSLLFPEFLGGYEFWGHCDIDIVWGDLQKVIFPLLEMDYVRIFKYGHLTIYRNTEEARNLFKLPYSGLTYQEALTTSISCGFDENKGTWQLAKENGISVFHDEICFDLKRPGFENTLQAYNANNDECQCFLWEDGHIYRYYRTERGEIGREERAYIHFQQRHPSFDKSIAHTVANLLKMQLFQLKRQKIWTYALDGTGYVKSSYGKN